MNKMERYETVCNVFYDKYDYCFGFDIKKDTWRKFDVDQLHNLVTEMIGNIQEIYDVIEEKRRDLKESI